MTKSRHRAGGFQLGRTFTIVIVLHVVFGAGVFWLSKSTAGQAILKQYNIKLLAPPEPEQAKQEEAPPPPMKTEAAPPPPQAAPQVAAVAPPAPSAQIGGSSIGGGGTSWSGRFAGGNFDGPLGAYHASVLGRFRQHWIEPEQAEQFNTAEIELVVTSSGAVKSFRIARSSGNQAIDQALMQACQKVQREGVGEPPEEQRQGSVVTVRFVPTVS